MTDRGLFIGRFQPPHLGHVEAATRLAAKHDELIVGIGSANVSHTSANPFTGGERVEMMRAALAEARVENALVIPIPDIGRNTLWVSHVKSLVPAFSVFYTNNPLPKRLFSEAGHRVEPVPFVERARFEGRLVRDALARDAGWRELVPAGVARVVDRVHGGARVKELLLPDGRVEGHDPSV